LPNVTSMNPTTLGTENKATVQTKRSFVRPSSSEMPESKKILTLQEQLSDLKRALKFDKSQYLSPGNDVSHHKRLYSVRLNYSKSMESLDAPYMGKA
jgi:hypothetical protein